LVAYDNDELTGRYGLERYYNDILDRRGTDLYVNFFADIFTNISDTFFSESPRRTGHVITSIEPTVQLFLENKTDEIQGTWNSRQTAAIIMNPATGAIYAMAVTPGFDPNNLSEVADPSVFSNPLVEDVFEMGSIIKPLTMAAALDAGAVRASTTYTDAGTVTLNGRRISNYDGRGRGSVTMQEVLNQSLNTGVVFAVTKMGNKTFADYMRSYGLGEETGIDLPSEGVGLIDNLESPRDIEYATASFGQGIAMTPIATVRALSVLANGGTLVTPHVARKIKLESGRTYDVDYPDGKRVLTEATSEEITRMLVEVVDEALMGGTVKRDHYSIAAKTGTAQIANPQGGGYYEDRYLHSFFGYFPAYDPQFLIFFYTLEPKGVSYASHTLTNPFMDTIDFLINYYGIAPDR
jgi:cell division protein FtsI (penicillin-binding protein 3)/stage V sporulation protein D (sporulation-specific penicillin-binding protein)